MALQWLVSAYVTSVHQSMLSAAVTFGFDFAPQVRLLAAGSGRVVFSYDLEAGEVPLVARGVHLADRSAAGRSRPLIAVGTSFSAGAASVL